jgi:hypothetical protein
MGARVSGALGAEGTIQLEDVSGRLFGQQRVGAQGQYELSLMRVLSGHGIVPRLGSREPRNEPDRIRLPDVQPASESGDGGETRVAVSADKPRDRRVVDSRSLGQHTLRDGASPQLQRQPGADVQTAFRVIDRLRRSSRSRLRLIDPDDAKWRGHPGFPFVDACRLQAA